MGLVLPTLAVAAIWVALGALVAGCGYATRRSISSLLAGDPRATLGRADLWIGFAAVLVFLQVWSLFDGISWVTSIPLLAVGLFGLAWNGKPGHIATRPRGSLWIGSATAIAILWLANKALGEPADYDFGLYHLGFVDYASTYAAIPGLANLHERLGAGDAHFLFVALLGRGPWSTAGFQLANGLLVSMLAFDIASRFVTTAAGRRREPFTHRMALLLVPATILTVGIGTNYRLSSPNIDLAAFVLVVVGGLYFAEGIERGFGATTVLAATGALAAAAATRPLYWIPTAIAVVVIAFAAAPSRSVSIRAAALAGALPAALAVGWMARQAVLAGYPLFPATVGGLPVEWRMPANAVDDMNRTNSAWARHPGQPADQVLGSWDWLGYWLRKRVHDGDSAAVLVLLTALVPALAASSPTDILHRRKGRAPMLAVLALAAPSLAAWFILAPDPRFALAPLWLIPVALVAWAAPARAGTGLDLPAAARTLIVPAALCAALAAGIAVALATTGILAPLLPPAATLAIWAATRIRRRSTVAAHAWRVLAPLCLTSITLAFVVLVALKGGFRPVAADGGGPLGTPVVPTPRVEPFVTSSGLRLLRPANGEDRCFRVPLCTPQPDVRIRLLGESPSEGFARSP